MKNNDFVLHLSLFAVVAFIFVDAALVSAAVAVVVF